MSKCQCGQDLYRFCCNSVCIYPAKHCDRLDCSAYKNHKLCSSYVIGSLDSISEKSIKKQQEIKQKISLVFRQFVEGLKSDFEKTNQSHRKLKKIIKRLNDNKDIGLTGKEIRQAFEKIDILSSKGDRMGPQQILRNYARQMQRIKNQTLEVRKKIISQLFDQPDEQQAQQAQQALPQQRSRSRSPALQRQPNNDR